MTDEIAAAIAGVQMVTYREERLPAILEGVDIDSMTLNEMEELSYALATKAGEAETAMWVVLAHIRDSEKWRSIQGVTWEHYATEWLHEVCARAGTQQPFSLREIQTRLSVHRRLVQGAKADTLKVMSASSDVMAKLTRAIGDWDPETGALVKMRPEVKANLSALYPDAATDMDLIRSAAETLSAIPVHHEAIDFIRSQIVGTKVAVVFEFMPQFPRGIPVIACRRTLTDMTTGEVAEIKIFQGTEPWPEDARVELERRLRRSA